MIILGLLSRIQRGVCRFCETIGSIGTLKNQSMFASFSKKRADYAKIVTTTTVNRPLQVQDAGQGPSHVLPPSGAVWQQPQREGAHQEDPGAWYGQHAGGVQQLPHKVWLQVYLEDEDGEGGEKS